MALPMSALDRLRVCIWWIAAVTCPAEEAILYQAEQPEIVFSKEANMVVRNVSGPGYADPLQTKTPIEFLSELKQNATKTQSVDALFKFIEFENGTSNGAPISIEHACSELMLDKEVAEAFDREFHWTNGVWDAKHVALMRMFHKAIPFHAEAPPLSLRCCATILVRMSKAIRIIEEDTRPDLELLSWPYKADKKLEDASRAFGARFDAHQKHFLFHFITLLTLPGTPRKVHAILFLLMGGAEGNRMRQIVKTKCKRFFTASRKGWIMTTVTRCIMEDANIFSLSALQSSLEDEAEAQRRLTCAQSAAATPPRPASPHINEKGGIKTLIRKALGIKKTSFKQTVS